MLKKIFFGFAALIALIIMFLGWRLWPLYELAQSILPSTAAEDYAKQVDSRIIIPTPIELVSQSYEPLKNAYWGELHVHTSESLDAVLFGTVGYGTMWGCAVAVKTL